MSQDFRVLQEAADWFAVLHSGRVREDERLAWQAWLAQPDHAHAWRKVERLSGQLQRLSGEPGGRAAAGMLGSRSGRRQALKTLSVLCGGGALAWLGGDRLSARGWFASQRSAVGEVRDLRLADGSQLWLNTDSAVDIAFDDAARTLALYRGEILVDAPTERRPLLLRSAEGVLRSERGAHFSLRQLDGETQLSLYAGDFMLRGAGSAATLLSAGRQWRFSPDGAITSGPLQRARQAWSGGMLLADDMRLDAFLAELGRYRHGYLGCDPRIAGLRVVGAFPLADTERVLDALASTLPVRVQRRLPWWVSLEPA
ncbi:FecR domain-containing protein [Pseudomonas sp.]|uniref:FecR domain-containing protein n=1 Tax=Pseudomonas sp. TaxID=306 RepID=UPI0028AF547B|nr:FecR domain-containing protein [Pseudomonas sp.]